MAAELSIRVAVVEDDDPTRDCLELLIDGKPGYHCVGAYRTAEEALRAPEAASADVLLLDIHLPGMPGTEAVKRFRERVSRPVVLMLTVFADEERIFESLCNGASGYLLKKTPPTRLLESIREAYEGGSPMSPEIARKVIRLFRELRPPMRDDVHLTEQETRLLSLFAEGHSYQAAADKLCVSINTIRSHIRTIYDKLHVHSKSEAVSKALKSRLI
jgi:DNA-binding NarL/FixJ family response regulator